VQQLLPALKLLAVQEREQAIGAMLQAACKHASVAPAGDLAAALLQHHEPDVRQATLAGLAAGQVHGLAALLGHPAVAGSLVAALADAGQPSQQLADGLLQAAAAVPAASDAAARCGQALLPWEPWLLCCAASPVAEPAVASILQLAASYKRSMWQHLGPLALTLFHSSPAVAAEAAAQMHAHLVQQRPAAGGAMLFNPLPFDGMLMPAGSSSSEGEPGNGASRAAATSAAKLFTAGDVQSLLAVASNPALPAELTAAALGQLAQVAGDERFGPMLCSETGGRLLADVHPACGVLGPACFGPH
jgi:hypothetical protein